MLEALTLKPEAFGLDISDLSLKIIKLKKKKGVLSLASFGEQRIKPGIIEAGEIKDEEALINIIRDSLSKVKGETIKTKYVVASLPETKAFLQVIQMPIMAGEELKKAAYFEAERYVPIPVEQLYLDSQIVRPVYGQLDHTDLLIAALSKKIVDSYVSCLQKAGLIPQALEIESQAIARALIKNEVTPVPLFLIDLGAARTSFIIFSGYSLRFTFSAPISSQGFTQAISKTLKVSLRKAEKLKRKHGLKNDTKEAQKVFRALTPHLTNLVNQIKKYLRYYIAHASHEHLPPGTKKEISKILLCGGGADLEGLSDFLSLELKLPVELGNPWVNILPEPLKEVPELPYKESLRYTTALGLALRGIKA